MKAFGPRKRRESTQEAPAPGTQEEALFTLAKDIEKLESQRQRLSSMLLVVLQGYEDVLRRVKASGDREVAVKTATHLRSLAGVYSALKSLGFLGAEERELVQDYVMSLREAASSLELGQRRVAQIHQKVSQQQRVLGQIHQRMAKLTGLKLDPTSFFDNPDKREVVRRKRAVERTLRQ